MKRVYPKLRQFRMKTIIFSRDSGGQCKLCEDPIEGMKLTTTGYNRSMFLPCFAIFFLSLTDLKNLSQIPGRASLKPPCSSWCSCRNRLITFWRFSMALPGKATGGWSAGVYGLRLGWWADGLGCVTASKRKPLRNFLRTLRRSSALLGDFSWPGGNQIMKSAENQRFLDLP